ncbi:MAG: glycosyltransferase family 39 protein [Blastocatellia bacterium]
MSKNTPITRLILLIVGVIALCIAVFFSSEDYIKFLLGIETKDLSWGPPLFRALLVFHGILLICVGLGWKMLTKRPAKTDSTYSLQEDAQISRTTLLVLIALSIVGLILRLWNLNSDLWVDEVFTLIDIVRLPFGEIVTSFSSQNQHMLFSVMAWASTSLFGESPWSFRLPSVLFGVGSIWAMFFLCRRLLGIREALFACTLMTFSYHHIWFSQNARGYMGLLFFTLLATWFWFEALEKRKWRWWLGYAAAIVLGMWIHMTMAFVVAAHGLLYLLLLAFPNLGGDGNASFESKAGIRPIAAWLLSVTVSLQLYALSLPEFLRVGLHEESKDSEWTNPIWVVTESLQGLSIGFAGIAVVLLGGAFVAFGWAVLFNKNRRLAILTVLPAILAGGTMLALGHNLWPRFFFFSMGFGILIVVYGAMTMPKALFEKIPSLKNHANLAQYAGVVFVSLMIIASMITVPRNYALPKQDFSGARDYVEANRLPSEEVVAVGLADFMYPKYFAPEWTVAKTGEELEKIDQESHKIWLVYTIPIEIRAFRPDLWTVIQRDYKVVKVFPGTLNGGEVFVCRKRDSDGVLNESSSTYDYSEDLAVWQQKPNVK